MNNSLGLRDIFPQTYYTHVCLKYLQVPEEDFDVD